MRKKAELRLQREPLSQEDEAALDAERAQDAHSREGEPPERARLLEVPQGR
jgi:hypothetical protein